ncbi:MAG: hypothetical protein ACI8UX_001106, partial [Psychromonas sp.]
AKCNNDAKVIINATLLQVGPTKINLILLMLGKIFY